MLTNTHADRGRPTLKYDERFRNGLVRDLDYRTLMCTRLNLCKNSRTILCKNSRLNVSLNRTEKRCSTPVNRSTKNVLDEVDLQVTGKHDAVFIILPEEIRHLNSVWKYVKCIEVAVIFLIIFIFACIIYCGSNVMPNKIDAIQQFIVSSSVYLSVIYAQLQVLSKYKPESMLPLDNSVSHILQVFVNPKCSHSFPHVIADIDSELCSKSETLATKECRSRYAKFIVIKVRYNRHVGQRDQEPSRIPAKKISRLLKKSRNLCALVRKHLKKNVPRSSRIHRLVYAFSRERKKLLSGQVRYLYLTQVKNKSKCVQEASRRRRKQMATSKSYTFHFKNSKKKCSEAATYKNLNHIMNCCKFNLSRDIEKNPGPTFIDPSKTIKAPYCQGNVDVFDPNAGRQCVGMSLCSLIYNYSNESITDSGDLIQIMNIGNELYSVLSRLLRQSYLLLTELPTMVTQC